MCACMCVLVKARTRSRPTHFQLSKCVDFKDSWLLSLEEQVLCTTLETGAFHSAGIIIYWDTCWTMLLKLLDCASTSTDLKHPVFLWATAYF